MATHVKFTVTHYRRPEHTHEEFMKWLVEEHVRLAMPVFKRHGVINYSLFTTPDPMNAALRAEMGGHRAGWDVADFDCFIEYTLKDAGTIKAILSDPEWAVSVENEPKWVDRSRALMSIGHVTPYLVESGEVVNMPK
ncbi:hypothetical protein F4861DRAFT_138490 [Xylaria intraflava]|nr:hypothetical protein F4861DRAFT_138490 [Xylaria intraflava]